MVSAMSPVTPKPAAVFSTLAITKSSDSRSTSAGTACRTTSCPGRPKMSPMKRMRMLRAHGDADLAAAALRDPGDADAQLAGLQRGRGVPPVVGAFEADGAREPSEAALRHVEAGVLVRA